MSEIVVRHSTEEDASAIRRVYTGPQAVAGILQLPYMAEAVFKERLASPAPGVRFGGGGVGAGGR